MHRMDHDMFPQDAISPTKIKILADFMDLLKLKRDP